MKIRINCASCVKTLNKNCKVCEGKIILDVNFEVFYNIIVKPRIYKSYSLYSFWYKNFSMDIEDVLQAIYIMLLKKSKTLSNTPPDEISKILNTLVTRQLYRIIGKGRNVGTYEFRCEEEFFNLGCHYDSQDLIFHCIKEYCPPQQYKVIYQKYCLGKKFIEISKNLKISKQRIGQLHAQAMKRIKKNIQNPFTFLRD